MQEGETWKIISCCGGNMHVRISVCVYMYVHVHRASCIEAS